MPFGKALQITTYTFIKRQPQQKQQKSKNKNQISQPEHVWLCPAVRLGVHAECGSVKCGQTQPHFKDTSSVLLLACVSLLVLR